jgi:hypothetical protein
VRWVTCQCCLPPVAEAAPPPSHRPATLPPSPSPRQPPLSTPATNPPKASASPNPNSTGVAASANPPLGAAATPRHRPPLPASPRLCHHPRHHQPQRQSPSHGWTTPLCGLAGDGPGRGGRGSRARYATGVQYPGINSPHMLGPSP